MTKLIVSFALAASLMACGGKSQTSTTPDNTSDTTQGVTDGTGGTTYGGATYGAPAAGPQ